MLPLSPGHFQLFNFKAGGPGVQERVMFCLAETKKGCK